MNTQVHILERERERAPALVDFMRPLSLAVRAEIELVRALRLRLSPSPDPGLEADLWFSPLVQAADVGAVILLPEVRAALQAELAEHPEELELSWDLLQELHADLDAVVLLEERLAYRALRARSPGVRDRAARERDLDLAIEEIGSVVQALRHNPSDPNLLSWIARFLPRLPHNIAGSEAAVVLKQEAGRALPDLLAPAIPSVDTPSSEPTLFSALATVEIGCRRVEGGLWLSLPPEEGAHTLDAPDTQPVRLEVGWPTTQGWREDYVNLSPDTPAQLINTPLGQLRLRTQDRRELRMQPDGQRPRLRTVLLPSIETLPEPIIETLEDLDWRWETQPESVLTATPYPETGEAAVAAILVIGATSRDFIDLVAPGNADQSGETSESAHSWPIDDELAAGAALLLCDGSKGQVQRLYPLAEEEARGSTARERKAHYADEVRKFTSAASNDSRRPLDQALREELIEIERAREKADINARGVPTQAIALIAWDQLHPKGEWGPPEFHNDYISEQPRLGELMEGGGTLWVVSSRPTPEGQRYQLAYRLEHTEVAHPMDDGRRRVITAAPGDITHFPPDDATGMLLELQFTDGNPMREPDDIDRRLQSIPELTAEAIDLLTAWADELLASDYPVEPGFRWRIEGESARHPDGHRGTVRSIALSADGRVALTAGNSSGDECIKVWDLRRADLRFTFEQAAEAGASTPLAISVDGSRALSAFGTELRLWDLRTGTLETTVFSAEGQSAWVDLTFAGPDHAVGVTAETTLWIGLTETPRIDIMGSKGSDNLAVAASASGERIAVLGRGQLAVWRRDRDKFDQIDRVEAAVEDSFFCQRRPLRFVDEERIVYGSPLQNWPLEQEPFSANVGASTAVADVDINGAVVMPLSTNGFVVLDNRGEATSPELEHGGSEISCLALSADGSTLMSADYEHELHVYQLPLVAGILGADQYSATSASDEDGSLEYQSEVDDSEVGDSEKHDSEGDDSEVDDSEEYDSEDDPDTDPLQGKLDELAEKLQGIRSVIDSDPVLDSIEASQALSEIVTATLLALGVIEGLVEDNRNTGSAGADDHMLQEAEGILDGIESLTESLESRLDQMRLQDLESSLGRALFRRTLGDCLDLGERTMGRANKPLRYEFGDVAGRYRTAIQPFRWLLQAQLLCAAADRELAKTMAEALTRELRKVWEASVAIVEVDGERAFVEPTSPESQFASGNAASQEMQLDPQEPTSQETLLARSDLVFVLITPALLREADSDPDWVQQLGERAHSGDLVLAIIGLGVDSLRKQLPQFSHTPYQIQLEEERILKAAPKERSEYYARELGPWISQFSDLIYNPERLLETLAQQPIS